ncbi:MAG TPA: hypothetical protein PKJ08_00005 [Candidatus Cloacimonadota bacterium]|nr:hypothetical protein [Candidatus Cloacimonadota bacterium]
MKTEIKINTGAYNQRRCGKPWIATVDFATNPRGEYRWGTWVGDHRNGSAGILIVEADEGDIVAKGQNDWRQPKNSVPTYYQVRNGELVELADRAEAYKLSVQK